MKGMLRPEHALTLRGCDKLEQVLQCPVCQNNLPFFPESSDPGIKVAKDVLMHPLQID